MKTKTLYDSINLLLGIWLVVSPWAFDMGSSPVAAWTAVVLGLAVAGVSVWSMARPVSRSPVWTNIAVAIALWLTPWLLGYSGTVNAAWNAWVVGVAVVTMAAVTFGEIGGAGLGELPRMPHQGHSR